MGEDEASRVSRGWQWSLAGLFAAVAAAPFAPQLRADCTLDCGAPAILEAFEAGNVEGDTAPFCQIKFCGVPQLLGVTYTLDDPLCDLHGEVPCKVTSESEWLFPKNGSNNCVQGSSINAGWKLDDAICGLSTAGTLDTDLGIARAHFSATCGDPPTKVLRAIACQGSACHQETQLPLDVRGSALCQPLPNGCGEGDAGAGMCCFGPAGGTSPAGTPPGFSVPGTNARLVYQAQGVGHPGSPAAADWIALSGLGRYWIHEFAARLVSVADPATVWLIPDGGTFRRFTDLDADGLYDEAAPSDEHRTLELDAPFPGEWTLTALDGSRTVFNADGSWQSTIDRLGNAWTGTYSGGLLDTVTFPDGRQEEFGYVAGRLATIQQIGLDDDGTQPSGAAADCTSGTECRTWSFRWAGDDLARIDYPDSTARELFYEDAAHPGYVTRRELVGADGISRRVEAAWEYTSGGRIGRTWRGAETFADGVEQYDFTSYDDETAPTVVAVTDPFGLTATYEIEYDPDSTKPRLTSSSGVCPSCGGPDEQLEYDDPSHPLRPSAVIDGNGNRTELTYNASSTVATRTEAVTTIQPRTVTFGYDADVPGLVTSEEWPSTSGIGFFERSWSYDPVSGVLESMTISGDEDSYDADGDGTADGAFTLTTTYGGHNAAGQPGTVDPSGVDAADLTAFTYDVPGRNGLLADGRTDPLVGTTSFDYDGLNRRTVVVDPNGIATETVYDPLDRVQQVTSAAATLDALTTEYEYDTFGELAAIVHPRGNVTAHGYDDAGRLVEVRRQAGLSLAAGDERTAYILNDFGLRVQEDDQVWDGVVWQTARTTEYQYSSRCHLDAIVHDGGAVTGYAYDCNGNLTAVWDASHPSASGTAPPTEVYVYDALDRLVEVRQPWVQGTDCRGAAAPGAAGRGA